MMGYYGTYALDKYYIEGALEYFAQRALGDPESHDAQYASGALRIALKNMKAQENRETERLHTVSDGSTQGDMRALEAECALLRRRIEWLTQARAGLIKKNWKRS
jgi:hypothetical protein